MVMSIISNLPVKYNGPSNQAVALAIEPNTLVKSFSLLSLCHLPKLNDAMCLVKNLSTGAIRQALASKLLPISYGKDAYLLELTSAVEGSDDV